jgi:putative ABC transport system substrate-binding protein
MVLLQLASPLGMAAAQPREKVSGVGYLNPGSQSDQGRQRRFDAFRQGLRELGYVEGRLAVLKEMVPNVSRVALLRQPSNPASAAQLREAEAAARAPGVRLQTFEARSPQEIDSTFAAMTRERASALVVLTDSIFTNQRRQIAELAAERRLPAAYGNSEHVEAGGLMAYSASFLDLERRAATFVDKILKGAKALGLTVPPALLLRADRVVE